MVGSRPEPPVHTLNRLDDGRGLPVGHAGMHEAFPGRSLRHELFDLVFLFHQEPQVRHALARHGNGVRAVHRRVHFGDDAGDRLPHAQ